MDVFDKIKEITGKKYIKLDKSGDHAIKRIIALCVLFGKDRLLIQDQGGWLTYKSFARRNGLMVVEVKTDYGVIDLADFENKLTPNCAVLINSLAGYFAEQPIEKIFELCQSKQCLLINDISGSVGTKNGMIGNILICSTGTYKPINLGYGGFIATNDEDLFNKIVNNVFDEKKLPGLEREVDRLEARKKNFRKISTQIKEDLKDMNILHREDKGINVVIKYDNQEQKERIINYCKEKNYPFTECPRYIRVLDTAISIEVKRLPLPD
ncbi:DegT/DnrJ/EryC1/StrS aminotransferase family protein [archaeon]|nr:DegT/DnrJ/EryC1/StrS aminotransferase family protein [archaeon]